MKLKDVENTRELLEILYMVPPIYHLNREAWPKRRERSRSTRTAMLISAEGRPSR
ncbi:MAG: glycoside hydrolase [Verrucomicrobiia bacterium]